MEKRLVIFMDGGVIQNMATNVPDLDIVVVDHDIEGSEEEAVTVLGQEALVSGWGKDDTADIVDPDMVDQVFKEIKEN